MSADTATTARVEPNPEALELLERFGAQILATARRYSATPHDAEDAYQRATEILLTQAEGDRGRALPLASHHHEARGARDQSPTRRVLPTGESESVPEPGEGSPDAHAQAEHVERLHLGAQALKRLKPQEVRCMLLRAEGYS